MIEKEFLSGAKSDQSLRRIAILLHTLPPRTHRALIGQLDVEAKRKVAHELESIGEVDALEQHRVLTMMLDQLHAETDRVKKVESEIQDEIFIGRARVSKKAGSPLASAMPPETDAVPTSEDSKSENVPHASTSGSASPSGVSPSGEKSADRNAFAMGTTELGFLAEMQINDAALLLANESAQTIAIALSSLPEHTASMLLPKMPGHVQEESIRQMEKMDAVPQQAAIEVAAHLKRQMMQHESTVQTSNPQVSDAPQSQPQPHPFASPQPISSVPVSQSGAMIYQFPRYTKENVVETAAGTQALSEPRAGDQARGLSEQLSQQTVQPAAPPPPHHASEQQAAEDDAARADRTLLDLPPQTLCRALGYATTRQAFLVLCGLPNEHAELILGMLPKRKARKVQSDMRRMGKLHLSEIDEAKKTVAEIAVRMALGEQDVQRSGAVA